MIEAMLIMLGIVCAGVAGYVWGVLDTRAVRRTRRIYLHTLKGYVIDAWHDGDASVGIVFDEEGILPDEPSKLDGLIDRGKVRPCVFEKD